MTPDLDESTLLSADGWIDGHWVSGTSRFPVLNPATQKEIATVADLDGDDAKRAIEAATRAFSTWRLTGVDERIRRVESWAAEIESHQQDLGRIIAAESGKPLREAVGEAGQCAALLRWFAARAADLSGAELGATEAQQNRTIKQPVGVVACITPWNFPAAAVAVKAGAAIAAGCTAIVKPSDETPLIALALATLADRAGLPAGVLNVLPCKNAASVGDVLCASEDVRMLSFTGSTRVGRHLYAICGPTVKRLALELGGNAPFLVFDDADLEKALDGAMGARFYNSGQICVGANRFLVQSGIYDTFSDRFATRVAALTAGDGADESSDIGPMINRGAVERLTHIVDSSVSSGAELLAGGWQDDGETLFFPATVLGNMTKDMPAWRTEIFGPVACLYRFETEDEAMQLANDTEAGLAAYVYSGDPARIERFSLGIEAGVIGANTTNIFSNDLPFGGIKQSGLGREHGYGCLDEYVEIKSLCTST